MSDYDENALINKKLPAEMLEKIFSFTSQYRDYNNISLVCVKWSKIILGLRKLNKSTFIDSLENGQIQWKSYSNKFCPTQRHSHSTARIGDRLYVFGGLSGASTSYNDLWMFDLNDKIWSRPVTLGSYPSPKAAASLLSYKNESLILYGGYSHPFSYPFNQQVNFFDELHIYNMNKDTFTCSQILFSQDAPKLAGHTASLIDKNKMILFGGCNGSLGNKINTVFCLDLENYNWINVVYSSNNDSNTKLETSRQINGIRPEPRYGHSQITLDDERILIIGGCGGPNKQFDDIWVLNWPKNYNLNPSWQQIIVQNQINSPSQLYCISFVRCENKLVTFGKPRLQSEKSIPVSNCSTKGQPLTLNRKHKKVELRSCSCSSILDIDKLKNTSSSYSNLTNRESCLVDNSNNNQNQNDNIFKRDNELILNKSQRNTIKRLEALQKIASKFNKLKDEKELKLIQQLNSTNLLNKSQNKCLIHSKIMQTFILDLDPLFTHDKNDNSKSYNSKQFVKWQPPIAEFDHAPSDTILYSLNYGINEIIFFGGMELESPSIHVIPSYEFVKHRISNKLYIMKPIDLNIL